MNELVIQPDSIGYSTQDLVTLGTMLTENGFTGAESRALISMVEQTAKQLALMMAPMLLDQVQKINQARVLAFSNQVRALPIQFGHISRDRVMQLVQALYSTPPQA